MAMDPEKLRYLAAKGHLGHAALLDPDAYVQQAMPQVGIPGSEQIAQNSTNEFGLSDRLKISIPKEQVPDTGTTKNIRSPEQAAKNEERLRNGMSTDQVTQLDQLGQ